MATVTTAAGSLAAFFLATELLKTFPGKRLVPDTLTAQPGFLLPVARPGGVFAVEALARFAGEHDARKRWRAAGSRRRDAAGAVEARAGGAGVVGGDAALLAAGGDWLVR